MNDEEEDDLGGAESPKTIPYERFQRVNAERRDLKKQLGELEALKAQAGRVAELEARIARGDAMLGLTRAGITDDDGAEVALMLWGKLPEKDRPGIAEWVAGLRENPDAAPKPLLAYLAKPAEPAAAPEARRPAPPDPSGSRSAGAPAVTSEAVRAAYAKAKASGSAEDAAEARRLAAAYAKG
jgi:hypothetical protein